MTTNPGPPPAFGSADLSNCEREQIHTPGSIQPHGALLVARIRDLAIEQHSENLSEFVACDGDIIGLPLREIDAALADTVEAALSQPADRHLTRSLDCTLAGSGDRFDVVVHRADPGRVVVEMEPAHPPPDQSAFIEQAFQTVLSALSLRQLCDDTARLFKELTGYDRVMVYRFDRDGHGEVFAERREAELEPYLGNRYPATDIPQIARRLYERNRIRVLVDVGYEPVPLYPSLGADGCELDMSLCSLRSVSPIHVQYLKNMGVSATLVISLMAGDTLWGLISCHHYAPRNPPYEIRTASELIAEMIATRIAALESFERSEAALAVLRVEKRIAESIGRSGDWKPALFDNGDMLLQPLSARGAALTCDAQIISTGEVPGTQQIKAIVRWLEARTAGEAFETSALGDEAAEFAALKPVASGLIAVPISRSPGEYLLWFRPERVRTVTWGGNPFKPVELGDDPADLSPRRSFAQWHQLVEGTADPWSPTEYTTAKMIAAVVEDLVYQFRAVRMLIIDDQLEQAQHNVSEAQQPMIVADAAGKLLLVNEAFRRLLPARHRHLVALDDLPALFRYEQRGRDMLDKITHDRQPWRGEIEIVAGREAISVLTLRADPVVVGHGRLLGFVLSFEDITDRKKIAAARRRFQEDVVSAHREVGPSLQNQTDLIYRNLAAVVVNNAQLAALEISDAMDLDRVPGMLDGIFDSVERTRSMLRHLLARQND